MRTHTSTPRRTLSSLAATGLLLLTTAAPALAGTLPAENQPGPGGSDSSSQVVPPPAAADDDLEFLQIGLGALGGIALSGLAAAAVQHRRPQRPQRHALA